MRWTLGAGLGAAATAAGVAGYAVALEPDWLVLERVVVQVPELHPALDGLTVAHLSDLHLGPYIGPEQIRAAVNMANSPSPDLIVITGDYVLSSARYAAPCAAELAALRAPLGVYAVLGNHDYWTDVEVIVAELERSGIPVLRNQSQRLEVAGTPLWLSGVDDVLERHDDLDATLADVPPGGPVLLLAHEPDFADEAARSPHRILMQISGHSHGGQINLPFFGRPILPPLGVRYPAGLQAVQGASWPVYTSRGIGVSPPPVRFNCRPEVALITLSRGS